MLRNLGFRSALSSILIINLAAGPGLLSAQQSSADVPPITIRATTRLVTVDVVVTDKKGNPITGLKAEDFTVEENGKKQKIAIFVPPGVVSGPAQSAPPPGILSNHPEHVRPAGVPTVLLLDACNSPFKDQAYARSQMLKYVVEQGKSGHPMAVLTLGDRIRVLQQFTSDPQVLMTAIRKLQPSEQILAAGPPAQESHGIADNPLRNSSATNDAIAAGTAAVQQFTDMKLGKACAAGWRRSCRSTSFVVLFEKPSRTVMMEDFVHNGCKMV